MKKVIKGFNNVFININERNSINQKDILSNLDSDITDESLINKGFFNGDLLICRNYSIDNSNMNMECGKIKFFDFYRSRLSIKKPSFYAISVNAIIDVKNEYTILIKRGEDTYSYQNYWDFPAGLIPFGTDLFERLVNCIFKDTGLKKEVLLMNNIPDFLVQRDEFLLFYYKVPCKLQKEEVELVIKDFDSLLLHKSEIERFVLKNKNIYPDFLRDIYKI